MLAFDRKRTMRKAGRSLRSDRRGTAMLELTILMPVLLVIGLGVIEFGHLLYKRHLVEAGVRDAARYLAAFADCPGRRTQAANLATYGNIDGTGAPRVPGWSLNATTEITCAPLQNDYGGVVLRAGYNGQRLVVQIHTTLDYTKMDLGFINKLNAFGSFIDLSQLPVQHHERWYGNR